MKFSKVLNQPYPQNLNKWKLIVIISVFISLFLWVFKPFGLQSLESENKDLIIIGYGFVTFAVLLIDLILIPFIVKNIFNEDNWKLYKEVLWLIFIVLTIGVGNYLYSVKLNVITWHGLTGFVLFTFFTLAIAIIPIVVIILITWNLHLRRNIDSSEKLNSSIDSSGTTIDNTLIKLNSGKEEFAFQINEILFMESDGNYINVNYCSEGVMKRQLIRNTIKNIEESLDSNCFIKTHRAYIVNIYKVKKVSGNSQGYVLTIENCEVQIPVSRSQTKLFKKALLNSRK